MGNLVWGLIESFQQFRQQFSRPPVPPPPRFSKKSQTEIHVYPYVLESSTIKVHVTSVSRCQTEISIKPNKDDTQLYSQLEYTPYCDIQGNSHRELNLPRKAKLQFSSQPNFHLYDFVDLDDDGLDELVQQLRKRAKERVQKNYKSVVHKGVDTRPFDSVDEMEPKKPPVKNVKSQAMTSAVPRVSHETQTIIRVYPHILENDKLKAHVCSDAKCQTEATVSPDEDNKMLYSLLEYMPPQNLEMYRQKTVKLQRMPKLKFTLKPQLRMEKFLYLDDDGLSELVLELRERSRRAASKNNFTTSFQEQETQTD